jgi:hypothetical protein
VHRIRHQQLIRGPEVRVKHYDKRFWDAFMEEKG